MGADFDTTYGLELAVKQSCSPLSTTPLSTSRFECQVLATLTDNADGWVDPGEDTSHAVHATLIKQRPASTR